MKFFFPILGCLNIAVKKFQIILGVFRLFKMVQSLLASLIRRSFCFLFASVAKTIWQLVMVCCSLCFELTTTQSNNEDLWSTMRWQLTPNYHEKKIIFFAIKEIIANNAAFESMQYRKQDYKRLWPKSCRTRPNIIFLDYRIVCNRVPIRIMSYLEYNPAQKIQK